MLFRSRSYSKSSAGLRLPAVPIGSKSKQVLMTAFKSDFLKVLTGRGFIHQASDAAGIDTLAAKGGLVSYVGYDCTASSLHVGSLLSIMMLHWMQVTGAGKPIALMGGGTTRVGDPSGKDETRQLRTIDEINANKDALKGVFAKLLTFEIGRAHV